jgi:hypothetical protein
MPKNQNTALEGCRKGNDKGAELVFSGWDIDVGLEE